MGQLGAHSRGIPSNPCWVSSWHPRGLCLLLMGLSPGCCSPCHSLLINQLCSSPRHSRWKREDRDRSGPLGTTPHVWGSQALAHSSHFAPLEKSWTEGSLLALRCVAMKQGWHGGSKIAYPLQCVYSWISLCGGFSSDALELLHRLPNSHKGILISRLLSKSISCDGNDCRELQFHHLVKDYTFLSLHFLEIFLFVFHIFHN